VRVGVVKAKFGLANLDSALVQAGAGTAVRVDLVDSVGHIVASSMAGTRFQLLAGASELTGATGDNSMSFGTEIARQHGAVTTANSGHWRVVAHGDLASF